MFRLHKNRQAKSGEKIDFKFTNFKALQVPKGWDKLFISVVAEQTGKTIVKSSKASVRNGNCQWTESLSESIWVSQDEISKEFEDCNYKLIVAMGTARSNVLGEAVINMTNYIDSKTSAAVSLPLKKCNSGTILQVKILCLTPIRKVRDGDLEETTSPKDDSKKDSHDSDSCSDRTDSQLSRSIGSFSGADLNSSFHSGEGSSKEACFSASSQLSYDAAEVPEPMENYSAKNNGSDIQRQDSASSQSSAPCSSPSSVITGTAEGTMIEELRAEAKMWERNARKLMVDLNQLKKEFSDQSLNQESLTTELSVATGECDGLRKELEQLKRLLTEKSMQKQTAIGDLSYEDGELRIQRELKDELKFQKESNADLSLQLKRSQESNIELVSVLQELEATNEKQKLEIEELLALGVSDNDMENIKQENKKLILQLEHGKESEKNLQLKVQTLERNLEETKLELQKYVVRNQSFPYETDIDIDSKLYYEEDMGSVHSVDINLVKEIEILKEKVQELEKDCNELTDENIELLYKLKQANNNSKEGGLALNSTGGELLSNSFVNFGFNTNEHKHSTQNLEEKLVKEIPSVAEKNNVPSNRKLESMKFELEVKVEELSRELAEKKLQIEKLESSIMSKKDEIKILGDSYDKLQVKYSDLQNEKKQIEEHMDVILRESDINSKCLTRLHDEVKLLTNSVDLQVSANKILESEKLKLEQECIQLSARISSLESQLKNVTNEKECQMKMKIELHESCLQLKESYGRLEQCLRRVDDFEDSLSLGLEDFGSKENLLSSELDSLIEENRRYEGTLAMFEGLCNESYLEKATEVQKLQEALAHLTDQLSSTQNDLNVMQMESDKKLSSLINELSMSKQNQDILVADNEKLLKQLEHYKSLEVKLNNYVNDLELKLSNSEKERKQHMEELTDLKVQLQQIAHLQDEVLDSRNELEATKNEREKVEAGFNLLSKDCQNLRTENNSLLDKITLLQKTVTEFEENQCKQKFKVLEEEKNECLKRSQSLEAELKLLKEEKQAQKEFSSGKVHGFSKTNGKNMLIKDTKHLKNDAIKTASQNHNGKKKPTSKSSQPHEPVKDPKDTSRNQSPAKAMDDSGCEIEDEAPHTPGADSVSRIQLLEKELAEALEANNNYKDQLSRLISGNQSSKPNPSSAVEGEVIAKERDETTKWALETELKDIRERYFHISLKYAEVEHQREELVMKLKAAKTERRWFS